MLHFAAFNRMPPRDRGRRRSPLLCSPNTFFIDERKKLSISASIVYSRSKECASDMRDRAGRPKGSASRPAALLSFEALGDLLTYMQDIVTVRDAIAAVWLTQVGFLLPCAVLFSADTDKPCSPGPVAPSFGRRKPRSAVPGSPSAVWRSLCGSI